MAVTRLMWLDGGRVQWIAVLLDRCGSCCLLLDDGGGPIEKVARQGKSVVLHGRVKSGVGLKRNDRQCDAVTND